MIPTTYYFIADELHHVIDAAHVAAGHDNRDDFFIR